MEFLFIMIIAMVLIGTFSGAATRRRHLGGGGAPRSQLYGPQQFGPQQFGPQPPMLQHPLSQGTYGMGGLNQGFGQGGYGHLEQPLSDASRDAVDTDITRFGGELRDLDLDVVGIELDAEAQADYSKALDAYENAKQSLRNAELDSDATHITHILEEGRYAIECVKARAHGRELPARRPPCFFNPAHGPSVMDVEWVPDGGVAREVPACALDAARVRSGANPHIRMVPVMGGQMVPYWEDSRQAAWARGYYEPYGMDPAIRQLTQGALMIGGFSLLMGFFDG